MLDKIVQHSKGDSREKMAIREEILHNSDFVVVAPDIKITPKMVEASKNYTKDINSGYIGELAE
jgi:hypothetical protein